MAEHSANLGAITLTERNLRAGSGPHVVRTETLKAGQVALPMGLLVARDAVGEIVPFAAAQEAAVGAGDAGGSKTFAGELGELVPGGLSVTDGVEAFTDDGFGGLTGDAGGSGKVNYQTGVFTVTFQSAPAAAAPVSASYQPALQGVLDRPAAAGAVNCEVLVHGKVTRGELKVGVAAQAAPDAGQLYALERLGIWPLG